MRYDEYLLSAHWIKTRRRAIGLAGGRCAWCPSRRRLNVHHLTYRRIGCERDDDLLVLCRCCHEKVHGLAPRKLRQLNEWQQTDVARRQHREEAAIRIAAEAKRYRDAVIAAMRPGRRYDPGSLATAVRCHVTIAEACLVQLNRESRVERSRGQWLRAY